FLIRQLKTISGYLKCISPMRWLKNIYPDFENPSPSLTEKYVLICLLIEILIALAFLAPGTSHSSIAAWVFGILSNTNCRNRRQDSGCHGGNFASSDIDTSRDKLC